MKRACVVCGKLTDKTRCPEHETKPFASSQARRKVTGRRRQRRNRAVLNHHDTVCHICDRPGATEVDHVIPLAEGGTDHPDNLRPAHTDCHRRKTEEEAKRGRAAQA